MENMDYTNIPKEKLKFASARDLSHDQKFATKPVSYFQGAFRRFCKNKGAVVGAIVIACLILFAIFAPLFTPYVPSSQDSRFGFATPKCNLFANAGFWDGGKEKKDAPKIDYLKHYAIQLETGYDVIKGEVKISEDGSTYSYRYDTYYEVGFGTYQSLTQEEYDDILRYQNQTGRQVLYPIVQFTDRPKDSSTVNGRSADANYYYKTIGEGKNIVPDLDENGNLVPNYWKYEKDGKAKGAAYDSLRIEGEDGIEIDGVTYYYVYARRVQGTEPMYEVRAYYYEYYRYYHTQVLKDGIEEPYFLFGTTGTGKDVFACLAYGARFSFVFALAVAVVNMVVGVIWGSIAGYFGGKIDLGMERFTDILSAVPTMIVITLLKYYMGDSSNALALFITFFMTGWIGIAGTTRMQFYRYKNQEYVLAARTLGARDSRIMFKHIFPNAIGTLVTSCALIIPSMIYSETSLSYLGIVNLEVGNLTSVGTLLAAGHSAWVYSSAYAYVLLFPLIFLVLLMLSFNLFGNGLRDAFNPSLRGSEE